MSQLLLILACIALGLLCLVLMAGAAACIMLNVFIVQDSKAERHRRKLQKKIEKVRFSK